MENIFLIATTILATAIITAVATYQFVILNQEIEKTPSGYQVTILNNIYDYE